MPFLLPGDLDDDDSESSSSSSDSESSRSTTTTRCTTTRDTICSASPNLIIPFNSAYQGVTVEIPQGTYVADLPVNVVVANQQSCTIQMGCTLTLPVVVCQPQASSTPQGAVIIQESNVPTENATTQALNSCFLSQVLAATSTGNCPSTSQVTTDVATRLAQLAFCDESTTAPVGLTSVSSLCCPTAASDIASALSSTTPTRAQLYLLANQLAMQTTNLTALCEAAVALEILLATSRSCDTLVCGDLEPAQCPGNWMSADRKRDTTPPTTTTTNGQMMIAFEQCGGAPSTPHDRDANDAVFAASANSLFNGTRWLGTHIFIVPRALGSTDDFALSVRFADLGLPPGAQVRVTHFGAEPTTDCYTANSQLHATADCPSAASVPLLRSVRAALPQYWGAPNQFVDTLDDDSRVTKPAHSVQLVALPQQTPAGATGNVRPAATVARKQITLHAELTTRGTTTCVVRTNGLASDAPGFGFVVPAPWAWPKEGVPIYLDDAHLSGQCVEGGNGGEVCSLKDECPGGYCDTKKQECVDAYDEDGESVYHKCALASQCPYGTCYGYDGSEELGAYAHFGEWLECREAGCYAATNMPSVKGAQRAVDPHCKLGNCHESQVLRWWAGGAAADLFSMESAKKK